MPEGVSFADGELAWTSFDKVAKIYKQRTQGQEQRFHPTQKPTDLMRYLILTYTNKGETIFDGYSGSGTTAEVCIKNNRFIIGMEREPVYFNVSTDRLNEVMTITNGGV